MSVNRSAEAVNNKDYSVPLTNLKNYLAVVEKTVPAKSKRDLDARQTVSATAISGLLGDILLVCSVRSFTISKSTSY